MNTLDLSPKVWGCDYAFTPDEGGLTGRLAGWHTPQPREGDYLLLKNGEDTSRYQITELRLCSDPPDMFFARVVFAPR